MRRLCIAALFTALLALGLPTTAAAAPSDPLFVFGAPEKVPPGSGFEGPCGIGVDSKGAFYVSDYYHDAVDVFTSARGFLTQLAGIDPADGPCGLAIDPAGRLYVNAYHRSVSRYVPAAYPIAPLGTYGSPVAIEAEEPTGISVDPIGDARPVGLAVDNSPSATQGRVYVTSGNGEAASVYAYGPGAATTAAPLCAPGGFCASEGGGGGGAGLAAAAPAAASARPAAAGPAAAASELTQKGHLRVAVSGRLSPRRLPRTGAAPIAVSVGGKFTTTDESLPPQLRTMRIELNRHGRLDTAGLPRCRIEQIHPASTARALRACRAALVGRGSFSVDVVLSGQQPYPTTGRLLVFNGTFKGRPALLGQIYSAHPFASSFVIPFAIHELKRGRYGLALTASLPLALASWGHVTGIAMKLSRRYSYRGQAHSFISAGCPAPKGFPGTLFSLARTTFGFAGGTKLSVSLTRSCTVRG